MSAKRDTPVAALECGESIVQPSPTPSSSTLTAAERRVAGLAADGMTNREIAQTLFVTVKTVEWHLRNTYVKLGIGSRQELRGLAPRPAVA